jgi:gentisate 1,2-dioxygenase
LFYYLCPVSHKESPLPHWRVFMHEIKTVSGKHTHQGGLLIYVLEGVGYSTVDGQRRDWKKGDLILLPMKPGGVEHQHFNLQPEKGPARWIAFINMPIHEHVASDLRQVENSPDFSAD